MSFIDKIRKTIRKHSMLCRGDTVLVAVSGGPDSVCLLRVLLTLAQEYELTLHVAHLDHRFRGEESAAEARFVAGLAEQFGIAATVEDRDVPVYCAERGLSAQTGAREARYRFLQETAGKIGAIRIALGHTANDQAETLLMRLIRGAGISGLSGIPPVRENYIRPLIDVTREAVMAYLYEIGQDYVTDPSNLKPVYTRNRIRQEVLPVLERLNPQAVAALASAAVLLRDEDLVIKNALRPVCDSVLRQDGEMVRIDRTAFNDLLPALQRRLLRTALAVHDDRAPELSWVQTEEVIAFMADAPTGKSIELPGGRILTREYDTMVLSSRTAESAFCIKLDVPGTTEVPELSLTVTTECSQYPLPVSRENENYLWQAYIDYDKIPLPLYLRNRRCGDWFCPAGMQGMSKKLQDYFVDEKVPQSRRARVPLLTTDEDLAWVIGMRMDGRFLPGPETKRLLTVTVQKKHVPR